MDGAEQKLSPITKPLGPKGAISALAVVAVLVGGVVFLTSANTQFRKVKREIDSHSFGVTKVKYGDTMAQVEAILGPPKELTKNDICCDDPKETDKTCTYLDYGEGNDSFGASFRGDKLVDGIELVKLVRDGVTLKATLTLRGRPNGAYSSFGNGYYYKKDQAGHTRWDEFGNELEPEDMPINNHAIKTVAP